MSQHTTHISSLKLQPIFNNTILTCWSYICIGNSKPMCVCKLLMSVLFASLLTHQYTNTFELSREC